MDLEVNTPLALEFHRLINKSNNTIYIHPSIKADISRDNNSTRAKLRRTLISKYSFVESPPPLAILDSEIVGTPEDETNDWVDNHLLATLQGSAADYLVTEDLKLHQKAKRLNLGDRVLHLNDAISILRDLFDKSPLPPPAVDEVYVYELEERDPIFNTLREDYNEFDNWLDKCKREHRKAYVIKDVESNNIAAICILKQEEQLLDSRNGKTLKLCTFKVSETHGGSRYGELLLKAVFDYIRANQYKYAYFTAYPKQDRLIAFAKDFGFYEIDSNINEYRGQVVLCKETKPTTADVANMSPLDLHIKYGPSITSFRDNFSFFVPIEPQYHEVLFPEYEKQISMFPGMHPCGNSIRKAYLSYSPITLIRRGDNLFFYRSRDHKSITVLGIVEDTKRSNSPDEIAKFVGKRTVYTYAEIAEMCKKNVFAIKFRQVSLLGTPIYMDRILNKNIFQAIPQSIAKIRNIEWLSQQI